MKPRVLRTIMRTGILALLLLPTSFPNLLFAQDRQGIQFIGITNLQSFVRSINDSGMVQLTSPPIQTGIQWDQLIVSWSLQPTDQVLMQIHARPICAAAKTPWYSLGQWTAQSGDAFGRKSDDLQRDEFGEVATDTLILHKSASAAEVRFTFSEPKTADYLRFVGLAFLDSKAHRNPMPPNTNAWGKVLDVPERSQMPYPDGKLLCSPATISMLLGYWIKPLGRADLDRSVPEIARRVWDENWGGPGNWSFNMAYAGSFAGIRAYVTRFSDLSEVENWVEAGFPVALSVCYNKLRGKAGEPSGHLVVCCGFTNKGDPILNDPGTTKNVRKVFLRQNLLNAWANSHQTVYLVYPLGASIPTNRFEHWHSEPNQAQ